MKIKIAAGILLILGFFLWITYFFYQIFVNYPSQIPDRLTIWLGLIFALFLLLSGISIGVGASFRKMLFGFLFLVAWSYGLLAIPTPEGYGEAVLGLWAILGLAAVVLYYEYEKSRKDKRTNRAN